MSPQNQESKMKTLIGVLASHDDVDKNNELARAFENIYDSKGGDLLEQFHFVFTGGTFQRVVRGEDTEPRRNGEEIIPIQDKYKELKNFLMRNSTILPDQRDGGVIILANLVVQRQCSILWPFMTPSTMHWLNPADLALHRLSDIWNVNRLMNRGSVEAWFSDEAKKDINRNRQEIPLKLKFSCEDFTPGKVKKLVNPDWFNHWNKKAKYLKAEPREGGGWRITKPIPKERKPEFHHKFESQTIALIAHDAMKERMIDFAIEYDRELSHFGRILATGTTGREVEEATRMLKAKGKTKRCRSGPKGGDIEISTEILYGRCDVVIFFVDPLHPHPHIEDIRVVFGACMVEGGVRMLTNELEARKWMDEVVRRHMHYVQ